ncbi:MAG TPA: SpoIIE family protein phosphatase, partial [Armatimonadota bacterium]|nr:SpoIIE family protein phosphatase [Armatimonadota bacterium]
EDYKFEMEKIDFLPGDVLLFYTDGATDARRNGDFLGIDGLESMFCSAALGHAHQIVDDIDRGVREYAEGFLRDDIALLVLKYRRHPRHVKQS